MAREYGSSSESDFEIVHLLSPVSPLVSISHQFRKTPFQTLKKYLNRPPCLGAFHPLKVNGGNIAKYIYLNPFKFQILSYTLVNYLIRFGCVQIFRVQISVLTREIFGEQFIRSKRSTD